MRLLAYGLVGCALACGSPDGGVKGGSDGPLDTGGRDGSGGGGGGADSGIYNSVGDCGSVGQWAQDCGLSSDEVQAEVRRCESQVEAVEASCGDDGVEVWSDAMVTLYDCYRTFGVCAEALDDPEVQSAMAECGASFDAAVQSLREECLGSSGGGSGTLETECGEAEQLADHVPPVVETNQLQLHDESLAEVALPFDFDWFGERVESLWISSNGLLFMAPGEETGCCEGRAFPQDDAVDGVVALGWTDLDPSQAGVISWGLAGDEGEQRLTVSFVDVPTYSGGGVVTSSAVLHEAGSAVDIHVGRIRSADQMVTVGVESTDATHGTCIGEIHATTGSWTGVSVRAVSAQP